MRASKRRPFLGDDALGLPDGGRDALIRAALDAPESALEAWRSWERSGASAWEDPVAQRWIPLIATRLHGVPLDPDTSRRFREVQHTIWASNVRIVTAAQPAIHALLARGVRTLVLKGGALAFQVYGGLGIRALGDVDVLVAPEQREAAERTLGGLGWEPLRKASPRDRHLVHGTNLRKAPDGALDLHWYLLPECCWAEADRALWDRARPLPEWGDGALALSAADQLMHVCLHGLRWSPVHGGYWIADAVRVVERAGASLDWSVVIEEAARRSMTLQMSEALRLIQTRGHVAIPAGVLHALSSTPPRWYERWECYFKGRPVVSAAGMFVIWTAWRRTADAARAQGLPRPSWLRYLAATLGVSSPSGLIRRLTTHAWREAAVAFDGRPTRGATRQEHLDVTRERA